MAEHESEFRSLFRLKKEKGREEKEILLLGYRVGEQCYATRIPYIKEILRIPTLYSMPQVPSFVKGVMDLRGVILPVIDLKERLGLGPVTDRKGRVVVMVFDRRHIGLLVDSVLEVFPARPSEVKASPEVFNQPHMGYLEGMIRKGDILYLVLNPGSVLTDKEMKALDASDLESLMLRGGGE